MWLQMNGLRSLGMARACTLRHPAHPRPMTEHHITVPRSARYHLLGDVRTAQAIWIVLHGYGQLARFFLNKFEGLQADLVIAAPEGLSRFYLDEAHQRVGATWMTREDREHEIQDQCNYLDALVAQLRTERPEVPVHVLGFSQGVATACRWSLLGRTSVDRLVLWAGGLPPEPSSEQMRAGWERTRIDLVRGTNDPYVGHKEFKEHTSRLDRSGIPHQVHSFNGGHVLEPVLLGRLLR